MPSRFFPYHALGFRCNPFRVLTDEEWEDVAIAPECVTAAVTDAGAHVQVLGDKGRGKTSALRAVAGELRAGGRTVTYEHIPEGQRRWRTDVRTIDDFLLDEAQRLSSREVRRLLVAQQRSGRLRLIIASHIDLTRAFAARGMRLETVRLNHLSLQHVRDVLAARLDYFALPDTPRVRLSENVAPRLIQIFGSDMAAIEATLYEVFQRLHGPGEVTADQMEAAAAGGRPSNPSGAMANG